MSETRTVERIITPSIEAMGFRIVRVTFGGGGRPTLQIMAEPADGRAMSVEDCAEISRAVSALLDVEDPIPVAYALEVTSPGIDRPLVSRGDFERFAGFEAKLELSRAIDGRKRFRGKVTGLRPDPEQGDQVALEVEGQAVTVPFDAILRAKLILTDELLKAAQDQQRSAAQHEPEAATAG